MSTINQMRDIVIIVMMVVQIKCIVRVPPKEVCLHLAAFRVLDKNTSEIDRREIPDVSAPRYMYELDLL